MANEHWIVNHWRPIVMLSFAVIIFNKFFLIPYINLVFGVNVVVDIPSQLWTAMGGGIGVIGIGRSGEKIAKIVKEIKSNGNQ